MEFRTVYNSQKVIECVEHTEQNVTGSTSKFIIDTIENTIIRLAAWGVNVSFFWKNNLAPRFEATSVSPLIDISNHPLNSEITRKVIVHSLTINQAEESFRMNCIVKHFDAEGNHITDQNYDDELSTILIDNSKLVDGVGEFDWFVGAINQGANLFQLQPAHIAIMDGNNRFDDIYG